MRQFIVPFLITAFFFGFVEKVKGWDYPLNVDVTEIHFDYESGQSNDALNIRFNKDDDVDKPEWPYNGSSSNIAYIKNQSNRKVKAKFWHNQGDNSDISTMTIGAIFDIGTGIGDLPPVTVSFPGGAATSSLTLFTGQDPTPGTIGEESFVWSWYVSKVNGQSIAMQEHASTSHGYFIILNTPQSPMSEPWVEVLEYACDWASGESSEDDVVDAITEGAYSDFGRIYSSRTHAENDVFDLTGMLNEVQSDCRDMSATVQVFSRAIGCSSVRFFYTDGTFYCKRIKPIGKPWWGSGQVNFVFHQVAVRYVGGIYVYDACLKLCEDIGVNERIPVYEYIDDPYYTDLYLSGNWGDDGELDDYTEVK